MGSCFSLNCKDDGASKRAGRSGSGSEGLSHLQDSSSASAEVAAHAPAVLEVDGTSAVSRTADRLVSGRQPQAEPLIASPNPFSLTRAAVATPPSGHSSSSEQMTTTTRNTSVETQIHSRTDTLSDLSCTFESLPVVVGP